MTMMITTEQACKETRLDAPALLWLVAAGKIGPAEDGTWDLGEIQRAQRALTGRCPTPRNRHPRWRISPAQAMADASAGRAAADRDERLSATIVTDHPAPDTIDVRDGHGRYAGSVVRGYALTGEVVWFIRPPSREAHAYVWDLPHRADQATAVRALFDGDYVL